MPLLLIRPPETLGNIPEDKAIYARLAQPGVLPRLLTATTYSWMEGYMDQSSFLYRVLIRITHMMTTHVILRMRPTIPGICNAFITIKATASIKHMPRRLSNTLLLRSSIVRCHRSWSLSFQL